MLQKTENVMSKFFKKHGREIIIMLIGIAFTAGGLVFLVNANANDIDEINKKLTINAAEHREIMVELKGIKTDMTHILRAVDIYNGIATSPNYKLSPYGNIYEDRSNN